MLIHTTETATESCFLDISSRTVFPTAHIPIVSFSFGRQLCDGEQPDAGINRRGIACTENDTAYLRYEYSNSRIQVLTTEGCQIKDSITLAGHGGAHGVDVKWLLLIRSTGSRIWSKGLAHAHRQIATKVDECGNKCAKVEGRWWKTKTTTTGTKKTPCRAPH